MVAYQTQDLIARFKASAQNFLSYVEALDKASWSARTLREGWPIGVAIHHVAVGAQFCSDLAIHVAEGGNITWTNEFVDQANASHAEAFAEIDPHEALEALRIQFPAALEKIEKLTSEQLSRDLGETHDFGEGPVKFAGDVVDRMIIAHIDDHLVSIREAVESS